MSTEAWVALSAVVGPVLVFITWIFSRRESAKGADFAAMASAVQASLDTTAVMKGLLGPLESEIKELRVELAQQTIKITLLQTHVVALEAQIKALGHEPLPRPNLGGAD